MFVVGDPDQSIYAFRGADPKGALSLRDRFPDLQTLHLPTSYRCPPEVVQLATSVITPIPPLFEEARVSLSTTKLSRPHTLKFAGCHSALDEGKQAARSVQNACKRGVPPSEIAVLYRIGQMPYTSRVAEQLRRCGIPFRVVGGLDMSEHVEVRILLAFAFLAMAPERFSHELDYLLFHLSGHLKLGLGDRTRHEMHRAAQQGRVPLVRTLAG